jgi:OOP family OmpA-OmpF porin
MNRSFAMKYIFFGLILSVSLIVSSFALVSFYEAKTLRLLKKETSDSELSWLNITIDGTSVLVDGFAPNEASRFKAITIVSSVINSALITDRIEIKKDIILPKLNYTLEFLRDDDDITLVGFVPKAVKIEELLYDLRAISDSTSINNLSETIEYSTAPGWKKTLNFAVDSLRMLPNSKITLQENKILITALSDSFEQGEVLRKKLNSSNPGFFELALDIESPRPLIQPFLFRLNRDGDKVELINCSASDEYSRALILGAVRQFGIKEKNNCEIGIGAPSSDWAEVVLVVLNYIKEFKQFSLTFKNREIFIEIFDSTGDKQFLKFEKKLRESVPNEFLIETSFQSGTEATEMELQNFIVTKNSEGLVHLKGYLPNKSAKIAIISYARSLFRSENVRDAITLTENPLVDLSIQALAGLEVMGLLKYGSLKIDPKSLVIKGQSADPDIKNIAQQLFAKKIEKDIFYKLELEYNPNLIPKPEGVNPVKCVSDINNVIKTLGVEFAPGEIILQPSSDKTIEKMAAIMRKCYVVPMEIGGHTDSQGRKSLNLSISQARAEAVMDALLSYDILTGNLSAKGFGESTPIADNNTVEGRNRNRRIEFTLINNEN